MIISQDKSKLFEERLTTFSVDIIKLCKKLKQTSTNRNTIDQLVRSATSVGANYTEANNASSRQDFRNKIFIAKKEASECRYWINILVATEDNIDVSQLYNECSEIIFILQKIVTTLKNGK